MPTRSKNLHKYGLTVEAYDWLLNEQGGSCACCKGYDTHHKSGRFVVDHCHLTETVRGLLCSKCNMGIAKLGDNLTGLLMAVDYLEDGGVSIVQKMLSSGLKGIRIGPIVFKTENWSKKLSWKEVEEIRLMKGKMSQQKIGEKFQISQTMVSSILRNATWKKEREGTIFKKIK